MTKPLPHRIGHPSPLIFHLGMAAFGYQAALAAAPKAHTPDFPWHSSLQAQATSLGDLDQTRLLAVTVKRLNSLVSGLEKWQTHPYRRKLQDPKTIWASGAARLLDYGTCPEAINPTGPPIVVLPSLINRAYILDLDESSSLLRYLASKGLRPLLLDWGTPSRSEQVFDFDNYAAERIIPVLNAAKNLCGRDVGLLGYCMGGTLAAGVLSQMEGGVEAFATIGSPWDFSNTRGISANLQALAKSPKTTDLTETLNSLGQAFGMIPAEALQVLFALISPLQAAVKFRKFDAMDPESLQAFHFAAIEDWLADSVPLPTKAAKNLLIDWNVNNTTAVGQWKLMGQNVDLAKVRVPSLAICGTRDSIVPVDVATPLAKAIPNCKLLLPNTGHVGMIVGSKAKFEVWAPLENFFRTNMRFK